MKRVRWQILHDGNEVGRLIDPTGGDRNFVRYTIVPAAGCEALLSNADLWQERKCQFQFRHPRTGEVVSELLGACGSKEEVAQRLAEHKVVMSRLQTTEDQIGKIHEPGWLERLRQIKEEIVAGYREANALERFTRQHPVEPVHEGRSFSSWLEDVFLQNEAGAKRAREAILAMREAAVPFLYRLVRFPGDLPKRTLAVEQKEVQEDSFNRDYHPNRFQERLVALFRSLTPLAGKLARELAPLLEPPIRSWEAGHILGAMGGEALPVLLAAARHPDGEVRLLILHGLWYLNPPVELALPTVRELMKDADPRVRYRSLNCLRDWIWDGKLEATPATTEWVIERLSDTDADVQVRAFLAYDDLSRKRKLDLATAVPLIRRMRAAPDLSIQTWAWLLEEGLHGSTAGGRQG